MNHILKLQSSVKEEWFNLAFARDSSNFKIVDAFLKNWALEGANKFGWDKKLIFAMVYAPELMIDKKGTLQINRYDSTSLIVPNWVGPPTNCGCASSDDLCDPIYHDYFCQTGINCKPSDIGCGTFYMYACNGICTA